MSTLLWILAGTVGVSLISLVGVLVLFFQEKTLKKLLLPLVALSAGALLAGALFHLLPETIDVLGNETIVWLLVIFGFTVFFILEQFIHWHHCHRVPSEHTDIKQPVTYLILLADAMHNFIDGLVLASAFLVDINLGLITFLILAAHEIPQELSDFGVLVYGGWSKSKALLFNLFSGLSMVIAGVMVYALSGTVETTFLLPFAAGGFIYIAAADLVPELKHNRRLDINLLHLLYFLVGIGLIFAVGWLE